MKLSIVIPVYNEENYIDAVIERVLAVPFPKEVSLELIAVDDCSRDATPEKLKRWEEKGIVKVFRHEKNAGKGAALHTGFAHATGDIVVVQDSDFEYNPKELPKLLTPILDGRADVAHAHKAHAEKVLCHLLPAPLMRDVNGVKTLRLLGDHHGRHMKAPIRGSALVNRNGHGNDSVNSPLRQLRQDVALLLEASSGAAYDHAPAIEERLVLDGLENLAEEGVRDFWYDYSDEAGAAPREALGNDVRLVSKLTHPVHDLHAGGSLHRGMAG